jgi:hypothetical protein
MKYTAALMFENLGYVNDNHVNTFEFTICLFFAYDVFSLVSEYINESCWSKLWADFARRTIQSQFHCFIVTSHLLGLLPFLVND